MDLAEETLPVAMWSMAAKPDHVSGRALTVVATDRPHDTGSERDHHHKTIRVRDLGLVTGPTALQHPVPWKGRLIRGPHQELGLVILDLRGRLPAGTSVATCAVGSWPDDHRPVDLGGTNGRSGVRPRLGTYVDLAPGADISLRLANVSFPLGFWWDRGGLLRGATS